jgi:hypothetical protein
LRLTSGSRESLAGRFERTTLAHWNAASLMQVFGAGADEAIDEIISRGAYPGAVGFRRDLVRWQAYVRDAIVEPAIGRDLLALAAVRRPALLRQVFGVAATSPAQIMSLQKIQGQLQDAGALEPSPTTCPCWKRPFSSPRLPSSPCARRVSGRRRRSSWSSATR